MEHSILFIISQSCSILLDPEVFQEPDRVGANFVLQPANAATSNTGKRIWKKLLWDLRSVVFINEINHFFIQCRYILLFGLRSSKIFLKSSPFLILSFMRIPPSYIAGLKVGFWYQNPRHNSHGAL